MIRSITNPSFDWLIKNSTCFEYLYVSKKGNFTAYFEWTLIKSYGEKNAFDIKIFAIQDNDDNWLYLNIWKGQDFKYVDDKFLSDLESEIVQRLFADEYDIDEPFEE